MFSSRLYNHRDPFFSTDLDRVFSSFLSPRLWQVPVATPRATPAVNVIENGNAYQLEMEVPGLTAQDIDIEVKGAELTLRGERKAHAPEGYTRRWNEIQTGAFVRKLQFPLELDASSVGAELVNGVLKLTLPKSAAAMPKKISINAH